MFKIVFRMFFPFLIVLLCLKGAFASEIVVSAAASTQQLVNEISLLFERKTGVKVVKNFTSSGKLAQQIAAGAPVDVYISASSKWIKFLNSKNLLKDVKVFASNELVVITPLDSSLFSFKNLKKAKAIAIADYRFAPCGRYAKEALENLGLWRDLKDKLILGKDVNQVIFWVMTGNADAGIVYRTDYMRAKNKVRKIYTFPENSHKPIAYFIAVVSGAEHPFKAEKFFSFFLKQKSILRKYGFKPVEE
ncbi:molybdate ABC transporter substrate-binding protein [Desulfurobacterium atlanticum]|uniref:Molybdate transport system substrate-binding protein n=1 Tax=Desulfurobacterium atlanticum TaxID=240169 RepID=A0A238YPD9_9BACT|nr:molybdate ABC transporter substrate-binding protein [Desulfurobacterium atlanticum]SNR73126.1 molybdate transport system substrate-binding protein [Desulfurobacterium atlanticum]